MTQVTVIIEDKIIGIDGHFLEVDFPYPDDIWAIQWRDGSGEAELIGHTLKELSIEDVQPYIDAHAKEMRRLYENSKAEQLSVDANEAARALRDSLLTNEFDGVASKPFLWASITEAKQAQYTTYRQALLDLPQSAGWTPHWVWVDTDEDKANHHVEMAGVSWPTAPNVID